MKSTPDQLNRILEHSRLGAAVTEEQIRALCGEAIEWRVGAVCVNPVWVSTARESLAGSPVRIVATCGFPLGASRLEIKKSEALLACSDGAHEIDLVANIGWLAGGRMSDARREIELIRQAIPFNCLLKVIVEAPLLSDTQLRSAVEVAADGGAQFVKSGTGTAGPATVEQITLLSDAAAGRLEVKAAGGIRTLTQCRLLCAAGASRLGSSACPQILEELHRETGQLG